MRDKIQENIENRIKRRGRGKLYVNADFADLGTSVGKPSNSSDQEFF